MYAYSKGSMLTTPAHALTYPQGAHAPFTCVQMCVRVYTYVRCVCIL